MSLKNKLAALVTASMGMLLLSACTGNVSNTGTNYSSTSNVNTETNTGSTLSTSGSTTNAIHHSMTGASTTY